MARISATVGCRSRVGASEGPDGTVGLPDLFDGRPQLVMHHFMWDFEVGEDGTERPRDYGCPSCSSAADGIPARLRQLHVRNTTLVAVTRAPYDKIAAFRERIGWTFPWYSSWGSDFNYDFHATVDDRVARVQIFYRTEAELAALGRQEAWEEPKVRAAPLGLHVGGPNMCLPDEYDEF